MANLLNDDEDGDDDNNNERCMSLFRVLLLPLHLLFVLCCAPCHLVFQLLARMVVGESFES